METHEWNDRDDEGRVFFRANHRGNRWTIMTTRMKRNPVWEDIIDPPVAVWQALRELVWNKYQRKRCPWQRVEELDRIIESANSK